MKSGVKILKKYIKHYISEYGVHLSPANWDGSKNVRAQENNLSVEKHRMVQFIACCRLRRSHSLWSTFLGQYDLKYREVSEKREKRLSFSLKNRISIFVVVHCLVVQYLMNSS